MEDINNIHDKFVKASFSDPVRAAAFLDMVLPESLKEVLNIDALKVLQESYLEGNMQEYFSDLVFEVPLTNHEETKVSVVFLFEHKSSPDKYVLLQTGHYLFSHWIKCIRQKATINPVIPLIYYQGKQKWKVPELRDLFPDLPESIAGFIPDFKHLFIALNTISNEHLSSIRNGMLAAALVAQQSRFDPIRFGKDLSRIFRLLPQEDQDRNFLEFIFVYVLQVTELSPEEIKNNLDLLPPTTKKNIMTAYEKLIEKGKIEGEKKGKIEGKIEGIIEGEKKGKIEGKIEVVLNGYDNNLGIHLLSNITNLGEAEVRKILKDHGKI